MKNSKFVWAAASFLIGAAVIAVMIAVLSGDPVALQAQRAGILKKIDAAHPVALSEFEKSFPSNIREKLMIDTYRMMGDDLTLAKSKAKKVGLLTVRAESLVQVAGR